LVECVSFLHDTNKRAHLDIKPDNVVFNDDLTLSLIDFAHSEDLNAKVNHPVGTKKLLAPEVRQNMKDGSSFDAEKADIFALGISLFMIMF